ncbi:MAG: Thioredoxin reductase [Alphaproteobacteria bacterium MarineAlpha2_Bin1]|nr:MAG: Thioredoxin reductase [Alphaproteobacteria bacterium MarineAlpha2_Bin1]|tara:strand:- start:650 stop:1594 length:945 start_codon:yes stop_codon:yes gene_type:complete
MQEYRSKVIILGSGPAGLSAAIYCSRANLQPLLIHGIQPGGQMTITTDVENYPGFEDVIQGPWLMEQMQKQAQKVGTKFINDNISSVDFSQKPFKCFGDSGNKYVSDIIIISTGAQASWLGLDSEEKYKGFGVSACATCDGFFFKEKNVAVIGGGNTAVEEALYLTNHARKVTLIHRRNELRAEKILQERLYNNDKIEIIWDTVVEEVIGSENPLSVEKIKLKNLLTQDTTYLNISGLFIAIGHIPNTGLFKDFIKMDNAGYIITKPDSTKTNIDGIFAAGDVQDSIFRQAVTAAGTGCMAALEVGKKIAEEKK